MVKSCLQNQNGWESVQQPVIHLQLRFVVLINIVDHGVVDQIFDHAATVVNRQLLLVRPHARGDIDKVFKGYNYVHERKHLEQKEINLHRVCEHNFMNIKSARTEFVSISL